MKYRVQIQNIHLFLRALISIVRYGKRVTVVTKQPKKILVVQLSKIGDMVCITPLLRAIRENLPLTKIIVLGDAINRDVLEGNPDVDEYIVFKRELLFTIVEKLKKENIEFACIRGIGFIGLVTALLAGIPTIVTGRVLPLMDYATRTYRALLPFVHTVTFIQGEYMPRQFLKLLQPLGIDATDTKKYLSHTEAGGRQARALLGTWADTDFIVGISASAGNRVKEWPAERFGEVADYMIQKYHARIVLLGGSSDATRIEKVLKQMQFKESVLNVQGKCSMDVLKAVIAKLDLFMSADTGPIYIAEAFGIPTIDITGPIDEKEQPPIGEKNIVITPPLRERPELYVLNARGYNYKEARRQAESITVRMVTDAFDALYPLLVKKHE
jgi:heptosyltransferase-2